MTDFGVFKVTLLHADTIKLLDACQGKGLLTYEALVEAEPLSEVDQILKGFGLLDAPTVATVEPKPPARQRQAKVAKQPAQPLDEAAMLARPKDPWGRTNMEPSLTRHGLKAVGKGDNNSITFKAPDPEVKGLLGLYNRKAGHWIVQGKEVPIPIPSDPTQGTWRYRVYDKAGDTRYYPLLFKGGPLKGQAIGNPELMKALGEGLMYVERVIIPSAASIRPPRG